MSDRRWSVALAGTVALVTAGLLLADPTLLVASAVPLVYVLFETVSAVPDSNSLSVRREFEPATPTPGERVTVTLRVTNEGRETMPDLRVVDGVPEAIAVVDGRPRVSVPLAPGAETVLEYTVVARRGDHEFTDPVGRLRSLAAGGRVTRSLDVEGEETLTCVTGERDRPVRRELAATAGGGMEFYATREYRQGDPMRRIDWRHVAKTGEFVTVQYLEQSRSRAVVVVDARRVGHVRPAPGYPSATVLCADSAERVAAAFDNAGVQTSVAAVGVNDSAVGDIDGVALDNPTGNGAEEALAWLDGTDSRLQRLLAGIRGSSGPPAGDEAPTVGSHPGEQSAPGGVALGGDQVGVRAQETGGVTARFLGRLPADARVVVCTPLLDDWPVALGRAVAGRGHSLVVVSPDVLARETPGTRLARVERRLRLRAVERVGETIDWDPEGPTAGLSRVGGQP